MLRTKGKREEIERGVTRVLRTGCPRIQRGVEVEVLRSKHRTGKERTENDGYGRPGKVARLHRTATGSELRLGERDPQIFICVERLQG